MVKINGKELNITGKVLADHFISTDYGLKRIAVERNGELGCGSFLPERPHGIERFLIF